MKRKLLPKRITLIVTLAAAALLPIFIKGYYFLYVLNIIIIYSILGISQNIVTGYGGQLAIGQAGFFAVGAYASALLSGKLGSPWWLEIAGVTVLSGIVGFILGAISLRMRGPALAIATIGFARATQLVLINAEELTGGAVGFVGIPEIHVGGLKVESPGSYYYIHLLSLVIVLVLVNNLINSRVGRGVIAIREDELAANVTGVNPTRYKIICFMLSSIFAGFAGYLYAHFAKALFPDFFSVALSVLILFIPIIGGMGTIFGPILGAAILVLSFELSGGFQEYQMFLYGFALVLFTMFLPSGLIGLGRGILNKYSLPERFRSGFADFD